MNKIKNNWKSFETELGLCAIAWNDKGITHFFLPMKTSIDLQNRFETSESKSPKWVTDIITKCSKHLKGDHQDLSTIPLCFDGLPPFHQQVYKKALKIKSGETCTYGELARDLNNPKASRAVGQALGKNPIALIVPCHRVLASGGKPGGFSAAGGVKTKFEMLTIEGAGKSETLKTKNDLKTALTFLQNNDKAISKVIKNIGEIDFTPKKDQSPYTSLFRAIVFQQLHGAAASTILNRVKKIYPKNNIPTPKELLATSDNLLWEAGLSKAKTRYLKALAQATIDKIVPTSKKIARMNNNDIIKQLTTIHGVGQWTVEMFLIFTLGRIDILPVGDYAIRKSMGEILKLKTMPTAKEATELGKKWKPYRSIASLYLWRNLDSK